MSAIENQPRDAGTMKTAGRAASRQDPGAHWLYPAGRVAVAASVALAVFLGMQFSLEEEQPSGPAMMADSGASPAGNGAVAPSDARIDAEAQRRLNEYIRNVAISGGNGRDSVEEALAELESLRSTPGLRPVSDRELLLPEPQENDAPR